MPNINDVHNEVGNLRGTLDTFIDELRERHRRDDNEKADTEKRLRSVERKQYYLTGVMGAALFAVQHFGATLLGLIRPQV